NIPATASSTTITFTPPLSAAPVYTPGQSVWWFQPQSVNGVPVPPFGVIGITGTPINTSATVTAWSPSGGPSGPGVLRIATGKIWGPYLPADKFQVAWVDPLAGTAAAGKNDTYQPVLLDRWGGIIQYF